jgi:hypothetical protein
VKRQCQVFPLFLRVTDLQGENPARVQHRFAVREDLRNLRTKFVDGRSD